MRAINRSLIFLATLAILVGCNADPRGRRELALMKSEIMDLEDQYYSLKATHERTLGELSAFENSSGPCADGELAPGEIQIDDGALFRETELKTAPPRKALPRKALPEPTPNSNNSILKQPTSDRPTRSGVSPTTTGEDNFPPITEVHINRQYTTAQNVDGQPGDDGLQLFLQPLESSGDIVLDSGAVTISLEDPDALPGEKNIGLWKFTAGEMALFAIVNQAEDGFLLRLPWDINVPNSPRLILSVQFTTPDGRVLESSDEIKIRPPARDYSPESRLITEWTELTPDSLTASDRATANNSLRGVRALPAKSTRPSGRPQWRPVR